MKMGTFGRKEYFLVVVLGFGLIILCLYRQTPSDFIHIQKDNGPIDLSNILFLPGHKYDEKSGVIYDCFTTGIKRTQPSLSRIRPFHVNTTGYKAEDPAQRQKSFQQIFDEQVWKKNKTSDMDKMSKDYQASGEGSTLIAAQAPLTLLNSLIDRLKMLLKKPVISIVDIPCGDFYWMRELVGRRLDVDYTGIDIVPTLIQRHRKEFGHMRNARFMNMDIVISGLNKSYDVIFSRDMLQHLTNADSMRVLDHFSSSGSRLLVTTNLYTERNIDLLRMKIWRYRHLNLMLPPINLVPPLCSMEDTFGNRFKHLDVWRLPLKQNNS